MLVEIPHAGLAIPEEVLAQADLPMDTVLRDADIYVDQLFANAPKLDATMLVAQHSRYVVDLNRAHDDVDAHTVADHPAPVAWQPRGVVWRTTTDGHAVMKQPLTYRALCERLQRYYYPYHSRLRQTMEQLRAQTGYAILIAGHSMPSAGRSQHRDPGARRADVVPGTHGGSTAAAGVIDLIDAHFRSAGLTVMHDDPYRGGWTTVHYGQPDKGWHAIQIELNRALYVDEATSEPREQDFERLRAVLDDLVRKLTRCDPRSL